MVRECFIFQMVKYLKVPGTMVKNMGLGNYRFKEKYLKVFGIMANYKGLMNDY